MPITKLSGLKKQGFDSLAEFFAASEELNTAEISAGVQTLNEVWQ